MLVPELDQNAVGVKTEPVDGTKLVSLLNQVLEANQGEEASSSKSGIQQQNLPGSVKTATQNNVSFTVKTGSEQQNNVPVPVKTGPEQQNNVPSSVKTEVLQPASFIGGTGS